MKKTSEKEVTKDPKRVETARKDREIYMNNLKESILKDAKKCGGNATNAGNETTYASNEATSATNTAITPVTTTRSNDMSMALVYLLSLLLVFVYYSLFRLKIKNRINHNEFMFLKNLNNE